MRRRECDAQRRVKLPGGTSGVKRRYNRREAMVKQLLKKGKELDPKTIASLSLHATGLSRSFTPAYFCRQLHAAGLSRNYFLNLTIVTP